MEEIQEHGGYRISDTNTHHDLEWLKQNGQFPIHHREHNPYIEAFWKWWPELYKTLVTFRITGGEPLLSDNTWKILDYVIADPRKNFKLDINTNLGVPRKLVERLVDNLKQLDDKIKPVIIYTSAESVGKQAEYSRFGMDWELFTSNIEYILSNTTEHTAVHFMTTVNILSASTFDKFLDYFCNLRRQYGSRLGFMVGYLRWPKHQLITLLDDNQKMIFEQKLNECIARNKDTLLLEEIDQIKRLIGFMNSHKQDVQLIKEFAIFFDEYDKRRGTNLLKTFPELTDVYNLGKNNCLL
jgi:organic radical activating enzyme